MKRVILCLAFLGLVLFQTTELNAKMRDLSDVELDQVSAGITPVEFLEFMQNRARDRGQAGENFTDEDIKELIQKFNEMFLLYADETRIEGVGYGDFFISLYINGQFVNQIQAPSSYDLIKISNIRPGGPGSASIGSFIFEGVHVKGEIKIDIRD